MSPIIYEALDYAVGATDAQGNLLAQGNGVTAFLGSLDSAVRGALAHYDNGAGLQPGDIILTNCPYLGGGTHLSDMVTILPVYYDGRIVAFTVNKAHWTEIGGMDTGSLTTRSTEIFQEGLHFKFLKLYEAGKLNASLVELIRDNVRLPDDTLGDMHAGIAAARVGARRIEGLISKYGLDALLNAMEELLDYGERMTRLELLKLPEGVYTAEDVIEEDGLGNGAVYNQGCSHPERRPLQRRFQRHVGAGAGTDQLLPCGIAHRRALCLQGGHQSGYPCQWRRVSSPGDHLSARDSTYCRIAGAGVPVFRVADRRHRRGLEGACAHRSGPPACRP